MIRLRDRGVFFVFLLPFILCLSSYAQTERPGCSAPSTDQSTVWGTQNVILKERTVLKSLNGKIFAGENEMAGVLVEIFDNADALLKGWKEREAMKAKQNRIAACVTDSTGTFSFPELPAGKYEVRFSIAGPWDSTSIYVIVDPKSSRSKNKKLIVRMQLS